MADNSTLTPETPTPGTSTPAGGTGTEANQGAGDPKVPTDPAEAARYWETRHKEATGHNTRIEQQNARYRDMYGDLDEQKPVPQNQPQPLPDNVWTKEDQRNWEMDQRIDRVPSIKPYAQEVKDLVGTGRVSFDRAVKIVAEDHNVTLGPSNDELDLMPTAPANGGSAPSSEFTPAQLQQMQAEGIDPEGAKKHAATLNNVWKQALKR